MPTPTLPVFVLLMLLLASGCVHCARLGRAAEAECEQQQGGRRGGRQSHAGRSHAGLLGRVRVGRAVPPAGRGRRGRSEMK